MEDEWKRGNRVSEQKEEGSKRGKRVSEENIDGWRKGGGAHSASFCLLISQKENGCA